MTTEELVPHNGIACPCPGTPHKDGDTVYLYPKLAFVDGVVVLRAVGVAKEAGAGDEELSAVLLNGYLERGLAKWTFTDANGPVPLNRDTVRAFTAGNLLEAIGIANHAETLYSAALIGPLATGASTSSTSTPTPTSTSATSGTSKKRRKR